MRPDIKPHADATPGMTSGTPSRRILPGIAVAVVAASLVTWLIFRPDRIAELHEVSPEIVAQVRAAFPDNREIPATVLIRFRESSDGSLYIRKQLTEPAAPSVLRRGSWLYNAANEAGTLEEASSLSIGPVVLVRHSREPLPLIGALLPNHFWHTRVLKRFEVKPGSRYAGAPTEAFEAMIWTEIRFTNGEIREVEQSRLLCTSVERVAARTVHASLVGEATKIRCEESGAPNAVMAAKLKEVMTEKEVKETTHFAVSDSWFVHSLGIAISTFSQQSIKIGSGDPEGSLMKVRTVESVEVKRKKNN